MFLHDLGYNMFNINRLTYSELNWLVESFNLREQRRERERKKNSAKNKGKR